MFYCIRTCNFRSYLLNDFTAISLKNNFVTLKFNLIIYPFKYPMYSFIINMMWPLHVSLFFLVVLQLMSIICMHWEFKHMFLCYEYCVLEQCVISSLFLLTKKVLVILLRYKYVYMYVYTIVFKLTIHILFIYSFILYKVSFIINICLNSCMNIQ